MLNSVELESPMLQDAKIQDHRTSGSGEKKLFLKVFTIYGHGGHLGHMTWTAFIHTFVHPFQWRLHMKFGFDWPCGYRGEDV